MRKQWARWRWPALLALTLMTALAPGALAAQTPRMQQLHPRGTQSLDQLSGDAFDQSFLTQMTMHHAMGVTMSQPVVAGGAHQELKTLGAQMIADQSREIEQMHGWLQGWYSQEVTCPMAQGTMPGMMPGTGMPMMPGATPGMMPGGAMPMPGPGMPMMGMPTTGMPMMGGFWSLPPDQLDAAFMTWMIAHHQGAIDMAMLADERAAHQEVKDLAATIIASQSAEIEMMQGWLAEWYGR